MLLLGAIMVQLFKKACYPYNVVKKPWVVPCERQEPNLRRHDHDLTHPQNMKQRDTPDTGCVEDFVDLDEIW